MFSGGYSRPNIQTSTHSKVIQGFAICIILSMFYCEWIVYISQRSYWPELRCPDNGTCTKILFIANPQIQGEQSVPSPFNRIFNFDSDQYLETTFAVAMNAFEPNVLVYLGNIMDEGSVATVDQFQRYVSRLDFTFKTLHPVVEVWVPGSKDIGDLIDQVATHKLEYFEKEFQDRHPVTFRNISFYKINGISNNFSSAEDNSTDLFKIVISQYPVILNDNLRQEIVQEIEPNIFFCTDLQDPKYVKYSKNLSMVETHRFMPQTEGQIMYDSFGNVYATLNCQEEQILQVEADDGFFHEIYVPPCSYRVGAGMMGYGAAIIDHESRTLNYTVLWSPHRYIYLFSYLALSVTIVVYLIVYYTTKWLKLKNAPGQKTVIVGTESGVPLIDVGEGDASEPAARTSDNTSTVD